MKRFALLFTAVVLMAVLLCACGEEPLEVDLQYVGTYEYTLQSVGETITRTVELHEDGTYLYTRKSTVIAHVGEFPGKWGVNKDGEIILKGDESGQFSTATPLNGRKSIDVADPGTANDTVGSGIYFRVKRTEN